MFIYSFGQKCVEKHRHECLYDKSTTSRYQCSNPGAGILKAVLIVYLTYSTYVMEFSSATSFKVEYSSNKCKRCRKRNLFNKTSAISSLLTGAQRARKTSSHVTLDRYIEHVPLPLGRCLWSNPSNTTVSDSRNK